MTVHCAECLFNLSNLKCPLVSRIIGMSCIFWKSPCAGFFLFLWTSCIQRIMSKSSLQSTPLRQLWRSVALASEDTSRKDSTCKTLLLWRRAPLHEGSPKHCRSCIDLGEYFKVVNWKSFHGLSLIIRGSHCLTDLRVWSLLVAKLPKDLWNNDVQLQ